jgi:hypothetical protein
VVLAEAHPEVASEASEVAASEVAVQEDRGNTNSIILSHCIDCKYNKNDNFRGISQLADAPDL